MNTKFELHRDHCCFYCHRCHYLIGECPVLNKSVAQSHLCDTCFENQADSKLVELVSELETLARACESTEEWARGRTSLTVSSNGIYKYADGHGEYQDAKVWYDDDDLCATVEDNPALGLWGNDFAKLFAKCSPKNILELCSLIRSTI